MALVDVKEYYSKMLAQYMEVKNDLVDFEKGLKDGYITEDQLSAAKEDVENIKNNLDRLTYIMFLFNLPKRKTKKVKYKCKNEDLLTYFNRVNADKDAVIDENVNLLADLRNEIKKMSR